MLDKILNHTFFKMNQKAIYLIIAVFFSICAWLTQYSNPKADAESPQPSIDAIDTYIPNGFVLIPIEIQNLESLDSIVGQYAVVDLYVPPQKVPIIKGVKLVRSPKNPSKFAVLVVDRISSTIVQKSVNPFQIVVQNPKMNQTTISKEIPKSRIHWED